MNIFFSKKIANYCSLHFRHITLPVHVYQWFRQRARPATLKAKMTIQCYMTKPVV